MEGQPGGSAESGGRWRRKIGGWRGGQGRRGGERAAENMEGDLEGMEGMEGMENKRLGAHGVVSGPEKTVVRAEEGSSTSTRVTNGAPCVSKISMLVANAGVEKPTRSHSSDALSGKGAHASSPLSTHWPSRVLGPVACAALKSESS